MNIINLKSGDLKPKVMYHEDNKVTIMGTFKWSSKPGEKDKVVNLNLIIIHSTNFSETFESAYICGSCNTHSKIDNYSLQLNFRKISPTNPIATFDIPEKNLKNLNVLKDQTYIITQKFDYDKLEKIEECKCNNINQPGRKAGNILVGG